MIDLKLVSKPQLKEALLSWELEARDGLCRPYEETLALPAEQVAAESTEHLWGVLSALPTFGGHNK